MHSGALSRDAGCKTRTHLQLNADFYPVTKPRRAPLHSIIILFNKYVKYVSEKVILDDNMEINITLWQI